MASLICLHHNPDKKQIWINVNFIISVLDQRPRHEWTGVYTFLGEPLEYHVEEAPEAIVKMIEKTMHPAFQYHVPDPVNFAKSEEMV